MRSTIVAAGILAIAAASAPGSAQTADSKNAAVAQALYDKAVAELDGKDFASACPKLEEVVRLVPEGLGAKLTLAECYEGTGKLASAWTQYALVQTAAARAGQAARAQKARDRAEALRPKLAELTLAVTPEARRTPGLEVLRDDLAVGTAQWGMELPIDAGEHRIMARAPHRKPWTAVVRIERDGDRREVTVPALVVDPDWKPPGDRAPERTWQRPLGLVVGGVGIAALGVGAGLGLVAMSKANESDDGHCNRLDVCDDDGQALRADALTMSHVSTSLFIGGGVLAAGGAVLFLTAPRHTEPTAYATVGLGGVAVRGDVVSAVCGRLVLALSIAWAIGGCHLILGIDEGIAPGEGAPCEHVEDCLAPVEPACQKVTCDSGACRYDESPDGFPAADDHPGDCKAVVCDGRGAGKTVTRPEDAEDDHDPCTVDACDGTTPTHALATELDCYTGDPSTLGKGSCHAGVQRCDASGSPIGGCEAEIVPQPEQCFSDDDEDCDGQVNEEGEGCDCTPGAVIDCYTGPPGTAGVGPCKAGSCVCAADGKGCGTSCDDVAPVPETCATPIDDDCDGETNESGEACVCLPSTTASCYDGPPATEDVGPCSAGTHTCNAAGTAWSDCQGQVLPAFDACATKLDDDCDAVPKDCDHLWSLGLGNSLNDVARGVAVDSEGAVIVAGEFAGNVDFGGGVVPSIGGSGDAVVLKRDAAGAYVWARTFGDAQYDAAQGVAIAADGSDDVLVTGQYAGNLNLGPGCVHSGGAVFVARLAKATGGCVWSRSYATAGWGRAIAADATGVYVTGIFSGTADFGGGPLVAVAGSPFVLKLDPGGGHVFSERFIAPGGDVTGIAVAGDIALVGSFAQPVDFGGGALVSAGGTDIFVAKLDRYTGAHIFSHAYGDADYEVGGGVARGAAGEIYTTGSFHGVFFDPVQAVKAVGGNDAFVLALDPAGQMAWSLPFGSTGNDYGAAIAVEDASGDLYLVGGFTDVATLGSETLISQGDQDVFVARLQAASGMPIWTKSFGGAGTEGPLAVSAGTGAVALAGKYACSGAASVDFVTPLPCNASADNLFAMAFRP